MITVKELTFGNSKAFWKGEAEKIGFFGGVTTYYIRLSCFKGCQYEKEEVEALILAAFSKKDWKVNKNGNEYVNLENKTTIVRSLTGKFGKRGKDKRKRKTRTDKNIENSTVEVEVIGLDNDLE